MLSWEKEYEAIIVAVVGISARLQARGEKYGEMDSLTSVVSFALGEFQLGME
jgi:hypothetical protein